MTWARILCVGALAGCAAAQVDDDPPECEQPPPRADACPITSDVFTPACYDPGASCDCPPYADEACVEGFPDTIGARFEPGPVDEVAYEGAWIWPLQGSASTRYLVAVHGSADLAVRELYWWYPRIAELRDCAGLDVGIIAVQWHDPTAAAEDGYLETDDLYALIDKRLSAEVAAGHAASSGHVFYGFSRGSARQYELAIVDRREHQWATRFIANSGAWPPDSPPPPEVAAAIDSGNATAAAGTSFYVFYGEQDHDPEQNGEIAQTNAAAVIEQLGATATLVADPTSCHSAFEEGEDADRAWPALIWAFVD